MDARRSSWNEFPKRINELDTWYTQSQICWSKEAVDLHSQWCFSQKHSFWGVTFMVAFVPTNVQKEAGAIGNICNFRIASMVKLVCVQINICSFNTKYSPHKGQSPSICLYQVHFTLRTSVRHSDFQTWKVAQSPYRFVKVLHERKQNR